MARSADRSRSPATFDARASGAIAPDALARARQVERVNAANLGLMLLSAALAFVVPFELFLFAYAVLGPLHYLTEISWLHDRGYFTTGRRDALVLAALGVLAFIGGYGHLFAWDGWVVLALALAAVFALVADRRLRWALAAAGLVVTFALERWSAGWLFLVVLLPTVIHVFGFTGLFILQGSVKQRSPLGFASFAVFLACGVGLLLYRPPSGAYAVSARTAGLTEAFLPVIDRLAALTMAPEGWDGLAAIGRFLGFAYTYHYLNWFSKTGIIGWHRIGRGRGVAIGALYATSLALYAYDYRLGLVALAMLSIVHVFLEFPLDVRAAVELAGVRRATPA